MPRTREQILDERRRLKQEYGELFDAIAALLFRDNPIGINFEVNPDEYQAEAGTILPRLRQCISAEDVTRVVHEEFVRWFRNSGRWVAGALQGYRARDMDDLERQDAA